MEYPHLVAGRKARCLAHFTVLKTGEPVRSGMLTVEAKDAAGKTHTWKTDAPTRDGLFTPEMRFAAAGGYQAQLVLRSPQAEDVVELGALVVHANERAAVAAAKAAAEAAAETEPPDTVSFLLEQQWKIGTLLEQVSTRTLTHRLHVVGEIVAPEGASAVVSAPVLGKLLAPKSGRIPDIGDQVEAGQIVAIVELPLPATEATQLMANEAAVRSVRAELALRGLDLDVKALEVDSAIIKAKARLKFAERALARIKTLQKKGIAATQKLDEVEETYELARAEYEGALASKRSYETALKKLTAIRSDVQSSPAKSEEGLSSLQMPLRAPIAGQVVSVEHFVGEHVEAHEEILRIMDLQRVWVLAQISEFDLAEVQDAPGAIMTVASYPGKRFDILGSGGGRLVNISPMVDTQSRTVTIRYELPNPERLLRAGMVADVFLETRRAVDALAIPEKAIVLDNGKPTAYVMLDGETFQKRELRLGIRDRGYVEVKNGVSAGERIVTKSGYAIKLASLSPASFGHGHGH
jgi:RND family efflux transporter MFP subunit